MKFTIRKSVFETNSSSSHSLIIKNTQGNKQKDILKGLNYNQETGILYIDEDFYFGRYPCHILTNFKEKLLYAVANLCTAKYDEDREVFIAVWNDNYTYLYDTLKEILPNFKEICIKDDLDFGTDDNILMPCLKEQHISMQDYLLNDRYIVICDGDEYNDFAALKKLGIVNSKIKEVY